MKHLVIFLLFSFSIIAQPRESEPLLYFTKEAVNVLSDGVVGWSYSLDGQWVSAEKKIPARLISRNKEDYEKDKNKLGLDNFEEFQMFPILYGGDTLIALVKIIENGQYRYSGIKKGWKTYKEAHYFVFNKRHLSKLKNLETGHSQIVKIPILDDGVIRDVKSRKVVDKLNSNIVIKNHYPRELALVAQVFEFKSMDPKKPESQEKIRFQLFSAYPGFKDPIGILKDFEMHGKTIYGSPELLNYLYYECDRVLYNHFFTTNGSFEYDKN